MLDSIYQHLLKSHFCSENIRGLPYIRDVVKSVIS